MNVQNDIYALLSGGDIEVRSASKFAALLPRIYRDWQLFFESEAKYSYAPPRGQLGGYFAYRVEQAVGALRPDPKEFFHVYSGTPLPCGVGSETAELLATGIKLAQSILVELERSLPPHVARRFGSPLGRMIEDVSRVVLRVTYYPRRQSDQQEDPTAAAPHKDINLLTLLPAATDKGLEVALEGGKWRAVNPTANEVLVLAGEMLEVASEGAIPACVHRVVATRLDSPRLSLNLFVNPPDGVLVHGTQTAGELLRKRLVELGYMK